jgi:hypothetical protein
VATIDTDAKRFFLHRKLSTVWWSLTTQRHIAHLLNDKLGYFSVNGFSRKAIINGLQKAGYTVEEI